MPRSMLSVALLAVLASSPALPMPTDFTSFPMCCPECRERVYRARTDEWYCGNCKLVVTPVVGEAKP